MAPLRSAGAVESEAGSPVMNHFLNTGAEGINHREEGFEEPRGSAQVYALPPPSTRPPPHPQSAPPSQCSKQTSTVEMTCQASLEVAKLHNH